MKKILTAAAILSAVSSLTQAGVLGATAGYNYWATSDFGAFQTGYAQFEHFIPLLPNAAVRFGKVDDKKLNFKSYDAYGYYELLDNDMVSVDLGAGLRRFNNGELKGQSFSDTVPMVNAEAEFFKALPTYGYARVDLGRSSDSRFQDMEAGVRFDVLTGFSIQAGYRVYDLDMNMKNKETVRGFTAGLRLDI
ncbi:hypothetical protein M3P05_06015 [Sansalvadorimonas sp. 2012CJ34-2]|uniref:Outer membrane protein beta-barrel domain-containing protein n=1 Tax=Parendozoicomonas callyspongiae TaxID=2942213 RepID=A0ABT0PDP7_9GAMM|nr:hypothetical protein [Sansalvadorimonas sp. 2012CJ34-2]MCL6269495.1 hypothetical protein [Sansalvadorimonas sp. 2012CJ34-2]